MNIWRDEFNIENITHNRVQAVHAHLKYTLPIYSETAEVVLAILYFR